MRNLLKFLKYHIYPVYLYKVSIDSQWMVGTREICEQERRNLLEAGYSPDEIFITFKVTTQAQLDRMPEFDGF